MALTIAACEKDPDLGQLDSDMVVYTDYDNETDFSKFQTYFLPDSILEAGSHHATYWKDENAQKLIDAVVAEMNSRGYQRITDPEQKSWGPWWGGWYYPYTVNYSYDTNTLVMEMVDLSDGGEENAKLPVVWYADASGYQYNSNYDIRLMTEAIGQAFEQSPYIQSNK